ncbi:hypothetical protein ACFLQ2_02520 [archaeon]
MPSGKPDQINVRFVLVNQDNIGEWEEAIKEVRVHKVKFRELIHSIKDGSATTVLGLLEGTKEPIAEYSSFFYPGGDIKTGYLRVREKYRGYDLGYHLIDVRDKHFHPDADKTVMVSRPKESLVPGIMERHDYKPIPQGNWLKLGTDKAPSTKPVVRTLKRKEFA